MIKKFKLFSFAGLFLVSCTIMVACGEPAAKEEAPQATEAIEEAPVEIVLDDTTNTVIDTTADQRPVNRR